MTRPIALITLVSATLALTACGGGGRHTATGESLIDIVRQERGYAASPTTCEVPVGLIGKPDSELAKLRFKQPIRVVYPGTALGGDQVINRLNFKVDKKGIIRDITCG